MISHYDLERLNRCVGRAMQLSVHSPAALHKLAGHTAWYLIRLHRPWLTYNDIGSLYGVHGGTVHRAVTVVIPDEAGTNKQYSKLLDALIEKTSWLSPYADKERRREKRKASVMNDLKALSERLGTGNVAHAKRCLLQIAANIEALL